jgi:hypothetical protein|tara:strand:+ start:8550 stop:10910 length:2361 start_codon:yes stop_codon:yes gene_type:complete
LKTKLNIFAASLLFLLSGCGGNDSGPKVIVPQNQTPVAQFSISQSQIAVGERVSFDASASHDPEQSALQYRWQIVTAQGQATTPSDATGVLVHFYPQHPGDYRVTLTVTDNLGVSHSLERSVQVGSSVTHNLSIAGAEKAAVGEHLQFQAIFSHLISDEITPEYSWQMLAQPAESKAVLNNVTQSRADFIADQRGEYRLALTLQLGQFIKRTIEHSISVHQAGDVPPQAKIDRTNLRQMRLNETLRLQSISTDADGDALSYQWTVLGAAYTAHPDYQAEFVFEPLALATYSLCLRVHDGKYHAKDCVDIEVTAENRQPVALFSTDTTELRPNTAIKLISQASDPDGDQLRYHWRIIAAPEQSQATLDTSDERYPLFLADKEGDYQIQLVVSDGSLQSAPYVLPLQLQKVMQPKLSINAEPLLTTNQWSRLQAVLSEVQSDAQFSWTLLSQPSGANTEFQPNSGPDVLFKTDLSGDYLIQVSMTGPTVESQQATLLLTADNNLPPLARIAGQTQRFSTVGERHIFDASISIDPEGEPLTYSWQLLDENSNTELAQQEGGAEFTFTPQLVGNYRLKLQVSDGTKHAEGSVLVVVAEQLLPQLELRGSFVNVGGEALAGQKVMTNQIALRPGYFGIYEAYTDNSGHFTLRFERPKPDSWQPGIRLGHSLRAGFQTTSLQLTEDNSVDLGQMTVADRQNVRFEARYCDNLSETDITFMLVARSSEETDLDIAAAGVLSFSTDLPIFTTKLLAPAVYEMRSNIASVKGAKRFTLPFSPDNVPTIVVDLCDQ